MKFAHKGCGEIVAEYLGACHLHYGTPLRSVDWLILGKQPEPCSPSDFVCPKCGERIGISMQFLEEVGVEFKSYGESDNPAMSEVAKEMLLYGMKK